jgi:hypothetical protein
LSHRPFCYKDPRFSCTLPLWEPFLPPDTAVVVMFRDPLTTARSILRHNEETGVAGDFPLGLEEAVSLWVCQYERLLERAGPDTLFLHYDQVLDGTAWQALSRFLDAELDTSFPDPHLSRSRKDELAEWPSRALRVYVRLLEAAGRGLRQFDVPAFVCRVDQSSTR